MNIEHQKELNHQHATSPQVGDYWSEHFSPVCVVLDVGVWSVTICRKTKEVDYNHWTWDLDKIETMPHQEFAKYLAYGSIPGYWAWVSPNSHLDVVEYAKELVEDKQNDYR